jgi:tetratricopeptide (TPR) repeat protein
VDGIVGRDAERAVVARFIAAAGAAPAVLTVDGEVGIGKTELWRHALQVSEAAGALTLRAAPGEQEAGLTFASLTDLLATVDHARIEALPDPQRSAIDAATLRGTGGADPPDARAIATGLATLLTDLAGEQPVIVAIDDVQWLDAPSLDALRFALRRVSGRIGVLACRRASSVGPELGDLAPSAEFREHIHLEGLTLGAMYVLIRERLGIALPRLRLTRLWEAAQGNPLLGLELARAASDAPETALAGDLTLPDRLHRLLTARLDALPEPGLATCLAVACGGRVTLAQLHDLGLDGSLSVAEDAGVLTVRGDRVAFTHPLLASVTLGRASVSQRRATHARLATVVGDGEARARHLALADPAPRADTADALEQAARAAVQRGSISAAIELGRLAVERTPLPESDDMWRRRVALATNLYAAGESSATYEVLADRDRLCPPGALRADAELLMAEVAFHGSGAVEATACANAALAHATDPVRRARALLTLDVVDRATYAPNRIPDALACLASLDEPDGPTLAWARIAELYMVQLAGRPVDPSAVDAIVALERQGRVWRSSDNAASNRPVLLLWIDEPVAALEALDELVWRAEEEGNEGSIPYVLGHRAGCLFALGRFREAAETASRHLAHAEATGQSGQHSQGRYLLANAAAYIGDVDDAHCEATALLDEQEAAGDDWMVGRLAGLLGVLEMARGNPSVARVQFDRWHAAARAGGEHGPAVRRFYVDYVEALIASGDRQAAGELVEWLVAAARRARRRAPEAAGLHGRALLAAEDGDLRAALGHLDAVLAFDDVALNDFERGRALLLRGTIHRRLKEKARARAALDEARALFEALGVQRFVARADAELGRLGGRVADRFALTPTERGIAELAAQGLTTREVAERMFISP